jgi:hypothetical protein
MFSLRMDQSGGPWAHRIPHVRVSVEGYFSCARGGGVGPELRRLHLFNVVDQVILLHVKLQKNASRGKQTLV